MVAVLHLIPKLIKTGRQESLITQRTTEDNWLFISRRKVFTLNHKIVYQAHCFLVQHMTMASTDDQPAQAGPACYSDS